MAIHGTDGVPGSGKTSYAVNRLWSARSQGVRTYANIPLYDLRLTPQGSPWERSTFGFPWSLFVDGVDDLLSVRSGLVLIDECDMWFAAVEWQKIPFEARRWWTQHRKQGLNIIWTCTFIDRVLNVIRDITELQFRCHAVPFFPRKRLIKMFNPQETGTVRKSAMWQLLTLHEQLWQLYHSAFIVGNGKASTEKGAVSSELGAADLGTEISVRCGSVDDFLHIAASGSLIRPVVGGKVQQVAPLMRPAVFFALWRWCERIEAEITFAVP